ncbi:hypothetical protein UPYG_G00013900 [Umbra pygmaea]|uniref:Uncharacterized protein n=1 Tax=Umbra pygmaea TaxID=75934 RepID=A0ABD0Y8B6_UMBPY
MHQAQLRYGATMGGLDIQQVAGVAPDYCVLRHCPQISRVPTKMKDTLLWKWVFKRLAVSFAVFKKQQ